MRNLIISLEAATDNVTKPDEKEKVVSQMTEDIYKLLVTTATDIWGWGYCFLCLLSSRDSLSCDELDDLSSLELEEKQAAIKSMAKSGFGPVPTKTSHLLESLIHATARSLDANRVNRPTAPALCQLLVPSPPLPPKYDMGNTDLRIILIGHSGMWRAACMAVK